MLSDRAIANCFNRLFLPTENTRMIGGADEPLYEPAQAKQPAILYYREDFAASALHEAAHWCIAGASRRSRVDFGYPYVPPPRTYEQQSAFFRMELKTQTLESIFADAAGIRFKPSVDNLNMDGQAVVDFANAVAACRTRMTHWIASREDSRARCFLRALSQIKPRA